MSTKNNKCLYKLNLYQPIANFILALLIAAVLSPLIYARDDKVLKCLYIILLMGSYWAGNLLPWPITALLPILLSPLLAINPSQIISTAYSSDSLILCLGRLFIACAFQEQNIHSRFTLKLMCLFKPQMKWMMLALMIPSFVMTMFISNTATAVVMMDMVVEFIAILRVVENETDLDKGIPNEAFTDDKDILERIETSVTSIKRPTMKSEKCKQENLILKEKLLKKISTGLSLATAWAASCGAASTIVACGPNLIFYGLVQRKYGYHTELNYASFLFYALPFGIITLFITWVWLCLVYLGPREFLKNRSNNRKEIRLEKKLKNRYKKLGPVKSGEILCLILTAILFVLWFTRRFNDFGWSKWFEVDLGNGVTKTYVTDAQPTLLIVALLFIIPTKLTLNKTPDGSLDKLSNRVLSWPTVMKTFPWGIIFLLGSGFALLEVCEESGFSETVSKLLDGLTHVPAGVVVIVTCMIACFTTELFSSTTLYPVLLPIFFRIATRMNVNPLLYGLALTISSSFAFCLPIATTPNIAVTSRNLATAKDLMKCGILLNLTFILLSTAAVMSYGQPLFKLGKIPTWLNTTS